MIQTIPKTSPAFDLGSIYMTPGAREVMAASNQFPSLFLFRHMNLDQGELTEPDYQENLMAAREGHRIFSSFKTANGEKLWVITESDRSSTTILTPDEY